MSYPEVEGRSAPNYAAVKDAFAKNLVAGGEVGAAVCVMKDGEVVVDLWGGCRDAARTTPWNRDTLVNIWSSTKGANATAFAMLIERGLARYDDKVAKFWPEFAAEGKGEVTLIELLSHQAGLPGFATPATVEDLYSGPVAAGRLALQKPLWKRGGGAGYHAISMGILSAELFARIEGRALKAFIEEEIARPNGLDLRLGLAPEDEGRAAEMIAPAGMASATIADLTPPQIAGLANPSLDPRLPNTAAWRAAELSSANGFANAPALAGLYARLLPGGVGGQRLVSDEVMAQATTVQVDGTDLVLNVHARWGAGYLVNTDDLYGPGARTFGHSGWGGSFGFGDPDRRLAVGYTMNAMSQVLRGDPRGQVLIDAAYSTKS